MLWESMFPAEHVDSDTVRYLFRIKLFMYYVKVKACAALLPGKDSYHSLPCCVLYP